MAVWISGPALADEARLDELYQELLAADPASVNRIERQIFAEWGKSGSASVDLLLQRGRDALEAGEFAIAAEHLTAAIDHAPEFAEAHSMRASAYYNLGLVGPALDDLREALVLNPRNFVALKGFAVILEELNRPDEAYEVYNRVLAIHPLAADVREALDRLEPQLQGKSL